MKQIEQKSSAQKSHKQKIRLGRYPYSLLHSGQYEKYFQILTDYQFIFAKINHPDFGIKALIEDYDLLDDTQTESHPQQTKNLKYIQRALRLSAHIINQDKQQLPSQLWGLLQSIPNPKIKQLLQQISTTQTHPWLRPLNPNITLTGENLRGKLLRTLSGHDGWVNTVAVTADGELVISGSSDQTVKVWNLKTKEEMFTLSGHDGWVNTVAVTADGELVISGSSDQTIKVWNLNTEEEPLTLSGHSRPVQAVAVTADGELVISGSRDQTIKVWSLNTKEELTLRGHSRPVQAVAVTADGKRVISGSWDKTVKVWNLNTGEEILTLCGHSEGVQAVAVTVDGERVISGSRDKTVKVWNLNTGEEILTLSGHDGWV
ncbi:MAG: WD40 repeat domain-containing protein, partial [Sphaerospermopsis sp. SIO1G2]|nr:WD40 repeat domain-containing protein [Sphaerospermopsis sp. SIO1G2]